MMYAAVDADAINNEMLSKSAANPYRQNTSAAIGHSSDSCMSSARYLRHKKKHL